MHITRHGLLAALAALAASAPAASAADPVTVTPDAPEATWQSAVGSGLNMSYFLGGTGPIPDGNCANEDERSRCDLTLVHVMGDDVGGGTITFRIEGFQPISDFDLRVYESDETGEMGNDLSDPNGDVAAESPLGDLDPRHTSVGDYETTTVSLDGYLDGMGGPLDAYFLVAVPYFLVAEDSFTGKVKIETTEYVPEVIEE